MKTILLLLATVLVIGCGELPQQQSTHRSKKGTARLTVYNPFETDLVRIKIGRRWRWKRVCWGRRTASGVKAQQRVTVAAPPWVPFGTKVVFPQLKNTILGQGPFVVQDRGAGQKIFHTREWFDLFVDNKRTMERLMRVLPDFTEYELQ